MKTGDAERILITGASGMLGVEVSKLFPLATNLNGRKQLELCDLDKVEHFLKQNNYSTIIHLAAITNLKECNKNREECEILHSKIVDVFNNSSRRLIYISTVPVWNKRTLKQNEHYFLTKLDGEIMTCKKKENLVIRANIVGDGGLSRWALEAARNNNKIFGYTNSYFNPIHTKQLAQFIYQCYIDGSSGVRSAFGDTIMSKYDFIEKLLCKKGFDLSCLGKIALQKSEDLVHYDSIPSSKIFKFEQCLEML